jgi:hypothetical protein
MAVQASSMAPAVPGRRVDATVPGPRRVAIISGPTGARRGHRYGTLLKQRLRVRSSRPRFGSSSGTPGPGVARELPFKSHFKGEAKFFFPSWWYWRISHPGMAITSRSAGRISVLRGPGLGGILSCLLPVSLMPAWAVLSGPAWRPAAGAPLCLGLCHGLRWVFLHDPCHAPCWAL